LNNIKLEKVKLIWRRKKSKSMEDSFKIRIHIKFYSISSLWFVLLIFINASRILRSLVVASLPMNSFDMLFLVFFKLDIKKRQMKRVQNFSIKFLSPISNFLRNSAEILVFELKTAEKFIILQIIELQKSTDDKVNKTSSFYSFFVQLVW
jgi:hypothetical protein